MADLEALLNEAFWPGLTVVEPPPLWKPPPPYLPRCSTCGRHFGAAVEAIRTAWEAGRPAGLELEALGLRAQDYCCRHAALALANLVTATHYPPRRLGGSYRGVEAAAQWIASLGPFGDKAAQVHEAAALLLAAGPLTCAVDDRQLVVEYLTLAPTQTPVCLDRDVPTTLHPTFNSPWIHMMARVALETANDTDVATLVLPVFPLPGPDIRIQGVSRTHKATGDRYPTGLVCVEDPWARCLGTARLRLVRTVTELPPDPTETRLQVEAYRIIKLVLLPGPKGHAEEHCADLVVLCGRRACGSAPLPLLAVLAALQGESSVTGLRATATWLAKAVTARAWWPAEAAAVALANGELRRLMEGSTQMALSPTARQVLAQARAVAPHHFRLLESRVGPNINAGAVLVELVCNLLDGARENVTAPAPAIPYVAVQDHHSLVTQLVPAMLHAATRQLIRRRQGLVALPTVYAEALRGALCKSGPNQPSRLVPIPAGNMTLLACWTRTLRKGTVDPSERKPAAHPVWAAGNVFNEQQPLTQVAKEATARWTAPVSWAVAWELLEEALVGMARSAPEAPAKEHAARVCLEGAPIAAVAPMALVPLARRCLDLKLNKGLAHLGFGVDLLRQTLTVLAHPGRPAQLFRVFGSKAPWPPSFDAALASGRLTYIDTYTRAQGLPLVGAVCVAEARPDAEAAEEGQRMYAATGLPSFFPVIPPGQGSTYQVARATPYACALRNGPAISNQYPTGPVPPNTVVSGSSNVTLDAAFPFHAADPGGLAPPATQIRGILALPTACTQEDSAQLIRPPGFGEQRTAWQCVLTVPAGSRTGSLGQVIRRGRFEQGEVLLVPAQYKGTYAEGVVAKYDGWVKQVHLRPDGSVSRLTVLYQPPAAGQEATNARKGFRPHNKNVETDGRGLRVRPGFGHHLDILVDPSGLLGRTCWQEVAEYGLAGQLRLGTIPGGPGDVFDTLPPAVGTSALAQRLLLRLLGHPDRTQLFTDEGRLIGAVPWSLGTSVQARDGHKATDRPQPSNIEPALAYWFVKLGICPADGRKHLVEEDGQFVSAYQTTLARQLATVNVGVTTQALPAYAVPDKAYPLLPLQQPPTLDTRLLAAMALARAPGAGCCEGTWTLRHPLATRMAAALAEALNGAALVEPNGSVRELEARLHHLNPADVQRASRDLQQSFRALMEALRAWTAPAQTVPLRLPGETLAEARRRPIPVAPVDAPWSFAVDRRASETRGHLAITATARRQTSVPPGVVVQLFDAVTPWLVAPTLRVTEAHGQTMRCPATGQMISTALAPATQNAAMLAEPGPSRWLLDHYSGLELAAALDGLVPEEAQAESPLLLRLRAAGAWSVPGLGAVSMLTTAGAELFNTRGQSLGGLHPGHGATPLLPALVPEVDVLVTLETRPPAQTSRAPWALLLAPGRMPRKARVRTAQLQQLRVSMPLLLELLDRGCPAKCLTLSTPPGNEPEAPAAKRARLADLEDLPLVGCIGCGNCVRLCEEFPTAAYPTLTAVHHHAATVLGWPQGATASHVGVETGSFPAAGLLSLVEPQEFAVEALAGDVFLLDYVVTSRLPSESLLKGTLRGAVAAAPALLDPLFDAIGRV